MAVTPFEAFMYPTLKNSLEVIHVSDLADICTKNYPCIKKRAL